MRAALLALSCAVLLAGCQRADVEHPDGDAVVLRIVFTAGLGPETNDDEPPPVVEVRGDGAVTGWRDDGSTYAFDASEIELQELLHDADDAGLLDDPPDYDPPTAIWDAGNTEVWVEADGGRFDHVADGLGQVEEDGDRAELLEFVTATVAWARDHPA